MFPDFFKDEKLILLLFTFDQVLSGDNGNPLIVFRSTAANDFIWFSFLTNE